MDLKAQINTHRLPRHVAIIMDGNGRWAKTQGLKRVTGHRQGTKAVRDTVEACAELGIENLTLFAFSTENWKRPKLEVHTLMELLVSSLKRELPTMIKNDIRLLSIGNIEKLPEKAQRELSDVIEKTTDNKRMNLVLALNYGARDELVCMTRSVSQLVKEDQLDPKDIDEHLIRQHLFTKDIPDVDLLIRTSGEERISNFLLWQIAYAELYFTQTLWPDFRREHLYEALIDYQNRERRFGKISEQL